MSIKRNKAVSSRVRKTKKGALLVRGKGRGHFNAKESRSKQLKKKRSVGLVMSQKAEQFYNLSR